MYRFHSCLKTQDCFFFILVSQSPKRKLAIVLLTSGIMFVNILPVCVVAIQQRRTGSEGQRVSGSDSLRGKFQNRFQNYGSASTMDCERVPPCSHACKVIKSTFPFKHYLRDVTKIVPALICSLFSVCTLWCVQTSKQSCHLEQ